MSDNASALSLRQTLLKTDVSEVAIHNSAAAMMRLYSEKGVTLAVNEWRNTLQTCKPTQLLPLLYVCNEVLFNSKRNRGPLFLHAFSPVLGNCLIFIAQRVQGVAGSSQQEKVALVEKVRRTAKIWGDRKIFSVRFVGELLKGLEPYRKGGNNSATPQTSKDASRGFSPQLTTGDTAPGAQTETLKYGSEEKDNKNNKEDDDEDMFNASDDDHDGGSPFASSGERALNVDVVITTPTAKKNTATIASLQKNAPPLPGAQQGVKRKRRASLLDNDGDDSAAMSPAKMPFSLTAFMELLQQLVQLNIAKRQSMSSIANIQLQKEEDVSEVVGDELVELYKQLLKHEETIKKERRNLYKIASQIRPLEAQAVRYISWCRSQQDEEQDTFCNELLEQLSLLEHIHSDALRKREERLAKEAKERALAKAEAKKQAEQEERRKFLESAVKEPEAQPGMVWNRALRQYQYLDTEESWRD